MLVLSSSWLSLCLLTRTRSRHWPLTPLIHAHKPNSCVVDEDRSQILIFGGRSASEMKLQDLYAWVRA